MITEWQNYTISLNLWKVTNDMESLFFADYWVSVRTNPLEFLGGLVYWSGSFFPADKSISLEGQKPELAQLAPREEFQIISGMIC